MTANDGLRVEYMINTVSHMDIFDLCDCLEDDSIDMILCDLPYGITACSWDTVIPFEPMWEAFKRIIKPKGAIVLTASGKFTYKLVMSNFEWFKYEWVWNKGQSGSFLNAKYNPLVIIEHCLIFGKSAINYYPIMRRGTLRFKGGNNQKTNMIYNELNGSGRYYSDDYYPTNYLYYGMSNKKNNYHPTQKPVALFEYLIRTYTQAGEVVFDPCVGSGTTAIAARNTGRNYICGDSSEEYVQVARDRLVLPYTMPMFEDVVAEEKPVQAVMEL